MKKLLFILLLFSCSEIDTNTPTINLINSYRNSNLEWSYELEKIATIHSNYMSETGFYSHTWKDSTGLSDRFVMVGYPVKYIAENIAYGYGTIERVMSAWMNDKCHRDNIVNENFNYVAVVEVDEYWTMVLSK